MHATVAVSLVSALLDHLENAGLERAALLHACGLEPAALVLPQRCIDAAYYEQLLWAGIARLHNPLIGLEFGMDAQPGRWGRLGFLLRHCATLGEALAYQARFAHLVNAIGEGRFVERTDDVAIEWHGPRPVMPAVLEEAFAAWLNFARWASGHDASPLRVEFEHRAQGDPAIYRHFFGCDVHFGCSASRICFDAALLALPLRGADAQLTAYMSAEIDQSARRVASQDIVDQLQNWLLASLGMPAPTLADAAAALQINERTLQQRLNSRDTSFRKSLDAARHTLALRYLGDAGLSVGDISHRLGFSEQSAFQRAFKRWTATTPLAWRRQRYRQSDPA
ncbi:AraC family transcriptional regulator [Salinisphaera sp. T5B8]|uniref:AraC family transcriptional regulator n=1 Tax=Salinisphaera sp. T5B8 TaxID=1304154 RepID=UPI003340B405